MPPAEEILVRPAGGTDLPHVLDAVRATRVPGLVAGGLTEADAERRAEEELARLLPDGLATPGMVFLVADEGGTSVGTLWLALRGPGPAGTSWIYNVHVVPAARGRGVARTLMQAARDEAARLGATALGLNVAGSNTAARALYESLGYEITALQMRLPLAGP